LRKAFDPKDPKKWPLRGQIAATSVGIVNGVAVLDLPYEEDSTAEVDMNVAMTDAGGFVELQGTAEGVPFTREQLTMLLGGIDLAQTRERKWYRKPLAQESSESRKTA